MKIRKVERSDIPQLVLVDKRAYGKYGADEKYFENKIASKNTTILVVEEKEKVTGFTVFEILKKDELPPDFVNLKIDKPIEDSWVHIIAFTTETNYLDIASDSKLVKAIEESTGKKIFCVSLSIDHPYINHDVFSFWEKNGYKNAGTIKWVSNSKEEIDCYFFLNSLSNFPKKINIKKNAIKTRA